MNFGSKSTGTECIQVMQEIARHQEPTHIAVLSKKLSPVEQKVFKWVNELGYSEGAWYRPMHNLIVTAAMASLSRRQDVSQDLIFPAMIHDAGNSLMTIAPASEGAAWESPDKRLEHMKVGSEMTFTVLTLLKSMGQLKISNDRIGELADIVSVHDNPYLGLPLEGAEAQALRSVDRCFVPSALSWYKDLISHYADSKYLDAAKRLGFSINPRNFLACRLAFFYANKDSLPQGWNDEELPLIPNLAEYNEGKRCEPCYTNTESEIVKYMFELRAIELEVLENISTPQEFGQLFEKALKTESKSIISTVPEEA